jgi:hypothetical protein
MSKGQLEILLKQVPSLQIPALPPLLNMKNNESIQRDAIANWKVFINNPGPNWTGQKGFPSGAAQAYDLKKPFEGKIMPIATAKALMEELRSCMKKAGVNL